MTKYQALKQLWKYLVSEGEVDADPMARITPPIVPEVPVPVLEEDGRPVGIVTDRDITCRAVAEGRDVSGVSADQVMSRAVITVSPETTIEACCDVLEKNQLRRVVVVDELGACRGIVAQADIARRAPKDDTVAVVRAVSKPAGKAVGAHA